MKFIPITNTVLIVIICVLLGLNFYQDRNQSYQVANYQEKASATQIAIKSDIDSINVKLEKLAEASMYLDSCQQVRINKSERAERRGKFVGGLLKALFPNL